MLAVGYARFDASWSGLSDAAMDCLFKPFKQAQRMAGGTGLGEMLSFSRCEIGCFIILPPPGLYSLAKRVEALKGNYGVSGRRDGQPGCLFWFSVPYKPDRTRTRSSVLLSTAGSTHQLADSEASVALQRQVSGSVGGDASPVSPSQMASEAGGWAPERLNILLVDDSLSILKMSGLLLRRQGECASLLQVCT